MQNHIAKLLRENAVPKDRRIGIEVERLGMWKDGNPLRYQPHQNHPGAEDLLKALAQNNQWETVAGRQGHIVGLKTPLGKVSLEPGSQVELSSDPEPDLYAVAEKVRCFEKEVTKVTSPWDLRWLGIAVNPINKVDEIDVIEAVRYHIMTDYLGKRGKLATAMMRLTTSVQINLDYTSEAEAVEMLRAALLIAPISYALFGNSPLKEGKVTEYLSYRGHIWRHTDPDRTGLLPEVFEPGFNFERYASYLWSRPLMFAQNKRGEYVPTNGMTLAQIAQGLLPGVEADEDNQMNAIREMFPEARLKPGYIEVRSIDGQTSAYRYAAAAFWTGALYNADARKFVLDTLGPVSFKDREVLFESCLRSGLRASYAGINIRDLSEKLVSKAKTELSRRGKGEEKFLEPLEKNLSRGLNPADLILKELQGPARNDISALMDVVGEK